MKPSTKKVQTAEEKAQATAKRLATRKQRGIGSKRAQPAAPGAGTPAASAPPETPAAPSTTTKS